MRGGSYHAAAMGSHRDGRGAARGREAAGSSPSRVSAACGPYAPSGKQYVGRTGGPSTPAPGVGASGLFTTRMLPDSLMAVAGATTSVTMTTLPMGAPYPGEYTMSTSKYSPGP